MRVLIAALVVVGLMVGVWLLWPESADEETPVTEAGASTTTTASTIAETTTTSPATSTTTTVDDSHVVESVEEAEEILRNLWFGWFEGIYNEDEERIREVVVLNETVETATESFGAEFARAPTPSDIEFSETEILRSDMGCLAVWTEMTLSGFREGSSSGVEILRWNGDGWKSLSVWPNRNDLWEADCEGSLP